mgnify:CR=1 FL=1
MTNYYFLPRRAEKKLAAPTFLINRSGIPINKEGWERMWTFYCGKQTKLRLGLKFMKNRSEVEIMVKNRNFGEKSKF